MPLTGGTELLNPHTLLERVGLRASMHVADLGCGVTGHFIVPAARVVGARPHGAGLRLRADQGGRLPPRDGTRVRIPHPDAALQIHPGQPCAIG